MSAHAAPPEPLRLAAPRWGSQPLYEKLRPAPHTRAPEQVAAIQRTRLCGAMVQAVAEHGYGKVTVSRLHRLAGVSKHTLYDRFGSTDAKRECLLSAIDGTLAASLERAQAHQRRGRDWRERLVLTLGALAQDVARHPTVARVVLIEAYEPEAGALEILARSCERLEELLAGCFEELPAGQDPPPLIVKGILAGAAHLARAHLLAGHERELPSRVAEVAAWACACCSDTPLAPALAPSRAIETSKPAPAFCSPRDADICEERVWMLEACARLAAEHGYGLLTISRIEKDARVARGALRRHFTGASECFVDAYEMVCSEVLTRAVERSSPRSPAGPRPALERLVGQIAALPDLARIAFCELLAAGPAGVRAQTRLLEAFAHAIVDPAPLGRQRRSPIALRASAAAVWGVAGHLAACGRAQRLPANRQILQRLMPSVDVHASSCAADGGHRCPQADQEPNPCQRAAVRAGG
jgi:AcrR family transcriptional regulator